MQLELKAMKYELALICAALFSYTALSNILFAVMSGIPAAAGVNGRVLPYIEAVGYTVPMAAAILILYRKDIDLRLNSTKSVFLACSPAAIFAAYIPIQLVAGMLNTFLENAGIKSYVSLSEIREGFLPMAEALVFSAVLPAFLEEILFRGLILQRLRKYGDVFAVVVSSILFTSLHGTLYALPLIFLLAMLFAYIDILSGSVLPSIFMHFINNFLSVALLWISEYRQQQYDRAVMLLIYLSLICLGIVSFVYSRAKAFGRIPKLNHYIHPARCFSSIAMVLYLSAMAGYIFYLTRSAT